ncbi:Uncharacterised protein [Mycobacteroides abscessus]|nr:Uncharacterised protein [Mycobacteroides abscessus]
MAIFTAASAGKSLGEPTQMVLKMVPISPTSIGRQLSVDIPCLDQAIAVPLVAASSSSMTRPEQSVPTLRSRGFQFPPYT